MPLPFSVSRGAIAPTIVTSSPSRIHTVPSPPTTSQWNRAHGSRSSRPGMFVLIVSACALTAPRYPRRQLLVFTDASLPDLRTPLSLRRGRHDDVVDVRAVRLARRPQGLRDRRRGCTVCARTRPGRPLRPRTACADDRPAAVAHLARVARSKVNAECRVRGPADGPAVICVNGGRAKPIEGTWSASLEWLRRRAPPPVPPA